MHATQDRTHAKESVGVESTGEVEAPPREKLIDRRQLVAGAGGLAALAALWAPSRAVARAPYRAAAGRRRARRCLPRRHLRARLRRGAQPAGGRPPGSRVLCRGLDLSRGHDPQRPRLRPTVGDRDRHLAVPRLVHAALRASTAARDLAAGVHARDRRARSNPRPGTSLSRRAPREACRWPCVR